MKRGIAMTPGFKREAGRLLKQHRLTPRETGEAIDATTLRRIGVELPERGKESDLIVWRENKDWLYLSWRRVRRTVRLMSRESTSSLTCLAIVATT